MLKQSDILTEENKTLRLKSRDVVFPLLDEDKNLINDILQYLRLSQDEEYAKENDIRAGMGLAFVQLGKPKKIFIISYKKDDGTFEEYVVINPKVLSHSEELIYVEEGEGCLSVNKECEGIVPRYARANIEYFDVNGNKQNVRVREEISVAFQHEIDHLEGILFFDKIDKENPYKNKENMRAI
jgi:peptide deformylase